jgi:hypothetical protein
MAYTEGLYEKADPAQTAKVDRDKETEGKAPADGLAARYFREIARYEGSTAEWHADGQDIEKLYLGEIETGSERRRLALLWTNVETLKPAVYPKMPVVQCARRYKDRDRKGRIAAELMERATNTTWDLYHVDEAFRMVTTDRLLPGRGQGWVRYEAEIEKIEEETEELDAETNEMVSRIISRERVASEKVCVDYCNWQDFGHNVARTWGEVWMVWRVVYKRHDEIVERWGSEWANKLTYNAKSPNGTYSTRTDNDDEDNRAKIYEVWDKRRRKTSWMAEGQREFLESGPPPIRFRDGFPCPEPCYATKGTKSLTPKPDYHYYRDQAKEINDLTDKIHRLTQWLTVKAFVPGGPSTVADAVEDAVTEKSNDELIVTVDSWKDWTDRGGAKGLIDWLPIDMVIQAITAAIAARQQLIQDVFQLTGISDILRGQTDPNETLGAQELKAQTGSRRLKSTRDEIARWCKDIAMLTAEVIAEQFQPQSIAEITGFRYVPMSEQPAMMPMGGNVLPFPGMQQQMMGHNGGPEMDAGDDPELVFDDSVMELLRNDKMRSFRIDVETDQTGQADENLEKQRAVELLTAVGTYMEKSVQVLTQAPEFAPASKELLMHAMRRFRTGKGLEDTVDKAFSQAMKAAMAARQAAAQKPDPEVAKVQAKAQADAQAARTDAQIKVATAQTEAKLEAQKQQTSAQLEIRKQDIDASLKSRQIQMDARAKAIEAGQRMLARLQPSAAAQ